MSHCTLVIHIVSALGLLLGYWWVFRFYPLPSAGLELAAVGITSPDEVFTGVFAHWNKNTNVATAVDGWLLNRLPRQSPFLFESHGYQTLTLAPTAINMLVGSWAGHAVLGVASPVAQRTRFWIAGTVGVLAGWWLGTWLCPLVKSTWTPFWVVFSSG